MQSLIVVHGGVLIISYYEKIALDSDNIGIVGIKLFIP